MHFRGDGTTVIKKIILSVLLVLELFTIFFFSSQNSDKSSEASGVVCEMIAKALTPGFDEMTEEEQELIVSKYQFVVRKGAHMTEFALLSATAYLFFIAVFSLRPPYAALSAIGFTSLCAFFDELHQSFVPGRAMQAVDMLIDTGGGVIGLLIAVLVRGLIYKRKAKKSEVNQDPED